MELTAAIEGLKALKEPCEVEVITDSEYVKNGITTWVHNWKLRDWMTKEKKAVVNRVKRRVPIRMLRLLRSTMDMQILSGSGCPITGATLVEITSAGAVPSFAFDRLAVDLDEHCELAAILKRVADRGAVGREAVRCDLEPAPSCGLAHAFHNSTGLKNSGTQI